MKKINKKKILFEFDFDKTLADAFEIQKEASKAIFEPYPIEGDMTLVDYEGSTHYHIIRDCLRKITGNAPSEDETQKAKDRWVDEIKRLSSKKPIRVYEGVNDVLSILQENAFLGLVTGNPSDIGFLLLEKSGLLQFFPEKTRVYGEMFGEENRVGGIKRCLTESSQYYGVNFHALVYVGDSVRDIEAGNNAKKVIPIKIYSAGVAHSEERSLENLSFKDADFAFRDFKDYERVTDSLLECI
ncbi:MAG: HAD hydrolase-like protein [Candidatus Woesearchaeota archaeon]